MTLEAIAVFVVLRKENRNVNRNVVTSRVSGSTILSIQTCFQGHFDTSLKSVIKMVDGT